MMGWYVVIVFSWGFGILIIYKVPANYGLRDRHFVPEPAPLSPDLPNPPPPPRSCAIFITHPEVMKKPQGGTDRDDQIEWFLPAPTLCDWPFLPVCMQPRIDDENRNDEQRLIWYAGGRVREKEETVWLFA